MKQLARLLQNALARKSVGEIDGGDVGKGTGAKVKAPWWVDASREGVWGLA
jgi:hypothetical protein